MAEIVHRSLKTKHPNIPKNFQEKELPNDNRIRRNAMDHAIPLLTEPSLARRFIESILCKKADDLQMQEG